MFLILSWGNKQQSNAHYVCMCPHKSFYSISLKYFPLNFTYFNGDTNVRDNKWITAIPEKIKKMCYLYASNETIRNWDGRSKHSPQYILPINFLTASPVLYNELYYLVKSSAICSGTVLLLLGENEASIWTTAFTKLCRLLQQKNKWHTYMNYKILPQWLTYSLAVDPKDSTLLIPKPIITHDAEPVSSTFHPYNSLPFILKALFLFSK
jgi:hypothetical protein